MFKRILLGAALAGTLAAGLAVTPVASANGTAWSVSIGAPGFAVSAGSPVYYGPYRGPYYRPYYYRPRPVYVPPPVVYAPPVYYTPYAYAPSYSGSYYRRW